VAGEAPASGGEVEAGRLAIGGRQPIPDAAKQFVWQRLRVRLKRFPEISTRSIPTSDESIRVDPPLCLTSGA